MTDCLVQHVTLSCGCTLLVSTPLVQPRVWQVVRTGEAMLCYWHEPPQRAMVTHERTAMQEEKERMLE